MRRPTPRVAAMSICVLSLVLVIAANVLLAVNGFTPVASEWGTVYNSIASVPMSVAFPIVGALIAVRRPGHAVGWLCLLIGLASSMWGFAGEYGFYLLERDSDRTLAAFMAWFSYWSWVVFIVPIGVFLVLLFPDGKLPSRRWRPVLWAGVVGMILTSLAYALYPGPVAPPPHDIRNPYALEGAKLLLDALYFGSVLLPISFVAAGASMVVRFRGSRGVERQQLKWFAYAAAVLAALFAVDEIAIVIGRGTSAVGAQRVLEDLVTVAFAAPAIGVGFAILRYRLYDIDIIINRTLVYASLTVVLAFVYAAGVVGIGGLLRGVAGQQGNSSLVVAISTMAVAGLFRPARARIQGLIDRFFYRGKYDAAKTLDGFLARVREEVALDALLEDLTATVQETMQPRRISVWLKR